MRAQQAQAQLSDPRLRQRPSRVSHRLAAERGAVVDFTVFLNACKVRYEELIDMAEQEGAEQEELLRAAQRAAALVLLGGGAPNSRPGQLWPLTVAREPARAPCLVPKCKRKDCPGNVLKLEGGMGRLTFYHHKNYESWRLEPALVDVQVPATGRPQPKARGAEAGAHARRRGPPRRRCLPSLRGPRCRLRAARAGPLCSAAAPACCSGTAPSAT